MYKIKSLNTIDNIMYEDIFFEINILTEYQKKNPLYLLTFYDYKNISCLSCKRMLTYNYKTMKNVIYVIEFINKTNCIYCKYCSKSKITYLKNINYTEYKTNKAVPNLKSIFKNKIGLYDKKLFPD